jgi:hypothetical protein
MFRTNNSNTLLFTLCVAVLMAGLLTAKRAAAETYSVYGANSFSTSIPQYWEQGYHPESYGSTLLGSANTTATFSGTYNFYIVKANIPNIALIDAVQGSDGGYYDTYLTGNTSDYQNSWGAPDGGYAHVAGLYDGQSGGYIAIDASAAALSSVTVFAAPVPEPGTDAVGRPGNADGRGPPTT